jgi:predicted DNA-binding ribbon-helix-helix protein
MTAGRYEDATAETACHCQALPIDPLFCTSDMKAEETEPEMKSLILKRSVVLRGHKTSISVEDAFWSSVKEIAASGQMSVSELISAIDSERHHGNLSSSIRLFVLNFYREQLLDRLDIRDKRKAIQRLISGTEGMPS